MGVSRAGSYTRQICSGRSSAVHILSLGSSNSHGLPHGRYTAGPLALSMHQTKYSRTISQ